MNLTIGRNILSLLTKIGPKTHYQFDVTIFKEEFCRRSDIQTNSIGAFNLELKKAIDKYNSYRPHFSLNKLTPLDYTDKILAA